MHQSHPHGGATPLTHSADWLETAVDGALRIQHAHERSAAFGLRRDDGADLAPLQADALAWTLARNEALCMHARPVMETLSAQIAGTESMVLLTDATGVVLHALGDDEILGRASRVALRPGATWSERSKGTNAIGTALALGEATQVHGSEHFLHANHFLTCSCAPIHDPQGHVIGALDVSGDHRRCSPHTMALVRMSAQMVENHLFGKVFEDAVLLRFHAREEFLGTLVEGLAAFTPDGRFLAANRSGQFQLGLSRAALQAHTFSSLFGMPMSGLLQHARATLPGRLSLWLHGGVAVAAQVDYRAPQPTLVPAAPDERPEPRWSARPGAPPARSAAPRPAPGGPAAAGRLSSLRFLDTGDAQLRQVIDRVTRLLGRDVPTMILGETGTGKELLAQAIHHDGPRAPGPFMAVNCASIPESLMEAELFGYEEGAFTGARRKGSPGKIVQAHGGTLFLDEIGDMPLALQARLLRVLQERTVVPLGSAREVPVDVHVLCATHRNLREMMARGLFRDDLYYRLNGLVVRLPALRERSDLPVIVQRLLQAQEREEGPPAASPAGRQPARTAPLRLSARAMQYLMSHRWPGNLRQLSNALRTAALMAGDAAEIDLEHLPEDLLDDGQGAAAPGWAPGPAADAPAMGAPAAPAAVRSWDDTVDSALRHALAVHGGNVSAVARALGVSRNTVYRRLRAMDAPPVRH
ncbi:sigma-54-dependent Fis family transcriptional regulator [Acidovorax sp. FG27]|uniref:sigma-54-dependent Fis family transcriptional regulator n=1 Tax=Acidovorax sp. FG27 TaxID=3133652 RepID=UPI0030EA38CA